MDIAGQERAINSLRDWSKWLIGLDFGGVAGCILILEQSNASFAVTPFLIVATALFGLSLGCSALLLRELAYVSELLPLRGPDNEPTTIFSHRGTIGRTVGELASLQLALLGLAAIFLIVWVVTKALAS